MDFPDLDLPLSDGGTLRRADVAGRPWVVYLTRHPG
jgi:peroxiredoxin